MDSFYCFIINVHIFISKRLNFGVLMQIFSKQTEYKMNYRMGTSFVVLLKCMIFSWFVFTESLSILST